MFFFVIGLGRFQIIWMWMLCSVLLLPGCHDWCHSYVFMLEGESDDLKGQDRASVKLHTNVFARQNRRERARQKSFIWWFTLCLVAKVRAGPEETQVLLLGLPVWMQGPKDSGNLSLFFVLFCFQVHSRGLNQKWSSQHSNWCPPEVASQAAASVTMQQCQLHIKCFFILLILFYLKPRMGWLLSKWLLAAVEMIKCFVC